MFLRFNLFALHYFLWFAAISAIYGYISVYITYYAHATPSQYGLLNMILPFVTIGTKIVFCSLADRHRAYRTFFVIFLTTALLGYGSFAVVPFLIQPPAQDDPVNYTTFSLICLMTSVATISMSVISCLSDAFAINSAKRYATSYGMIRLWGTIGWGISSIVLAFINQSKSLPKLVPGLIMLIVLIAIDILAVILWRNKDDFKLDKSASDAGVDDVVTVLASDSRSKPSGDSVACEEQPVQNNPQVESNYGTTKISNTPSIQLSDIRYQDAQVDITSVKMQWILFKQVASRRRSIFRYTTLFTISGVLISLQWSYFFLYLEKIFPDDGDFLTALSMFAQSMLGELPFFLCSQNIIRALGRSHSLSLSIASIGCRYLLYEYLLPHDMYYVLLTECLQGPNFGLFYVVMTEVGLDYSDCEEAIVHIVDQGIVPNNPDQIDKLRQALRATMQSLMSACYEGLGLGIGSLVGGLVIQYYGYNNLWFYASVTAILLGFINFFIDLSGLPILKDEQPTVILTT